MVKAPRRQVAEAIVKLLDDGKNPDELAKNIAAYVITERRTAELDSLLRDVRGIREDRGLLEVTASSAFALDDTVKNEIKRLLVAAHPPGTKVIIDEIPDEALIGGVRLETVGKRLDLTVASRLERLKRVKPAEQQA